MKTRNPLIGIIMGSDSDWPTLSPAAEVLTRFGVPHEVRVVSAHRTPGLLYEYAKSAQERGLACIIAGAGGAAHLPGMMAAIATVPVLGVPVVFVIENNRYAYSTPVSEQFVSPNLVERARG